MSSKVRTVACLLVASLGICLCTAQVLESQGSSRQRPKKRSDSAPSQNTLFVTCHENEGSKLVLSPFSLSEDEKWRAYVEVNVQGSLGCLYTTRLWVGRGNRAYRLVYLMPPKRNLSGNEMEILGWAENSSMLLAKTELWQNASDAPVAQQILAIDASTGMVYEPEMEAMLQGRKDKQCTFRVIDAGFGAEVNVNILVRAKFFTALDVDESEADVPPAKRCGDASETWSFNYATGEIKQVKNTDALRLFKKFLPSGPVK
jgi:hypothetical protein